MDFDLLFVMPTKGIINTILHEEGFLITSPCLNSVLKPHWYLTCQGAHRHALYNLMMVQFLLEYGSNSLLNFRIMLWQTSHTMVDPEVLITAPIL